LFTAVKMILTNEDHAALSRKDWLFNGNMTPFVAREIRAVEDIFMSNVTSGMRSRPTYMQEDMISHSFGYSVLHV
jgi:hypothetical protein